MLLFALGDFKKKIEGRPRKRKVVKGTEVSGNLEKKMEFWRNWGGDGGKKAESTATAPSLGWEKMGETQKMKEPSPIKNSLGTEQG